MHFWLNKCGGSFTRLKSLFYRVFKTKIFPNTTVMATNNPTNASNAWKSIIKGRNVIKRGAVWRIGLGNSIHVWGDNWLLVKNKPIIISPKLDGRDTVFSDFIDPVYRTWREEVIDNVFYDFEAAIINNIPLCHSIQEDFLIRLFNPDGEYSVKSGYKFLQEASTLQQPGPSTTDSMKPLWKKIWSLGSP